jgi:ATP-binding cassette, subfamily G (WHITE), member 2, PDR
MPGFWIFMYRVSPFTYLVSALLSTAVSGTQVVCDNVELLRFDPPANYTCKEYLGLYVQTLGGYVSNPDATTNCGLCTMSSTDTFLATVSIYWKDAWRNLGFMWAYIVFNISAALLLYWVARVPKTKRAKAVS